MEERHIRNNPPQRSEVEKLAHMLTGGAKDLISTRSRRFRELKPDLDSLDEQALIDLIANEPLILRRPIITNGRQAVVGFDEKALEQLVRA